MGTIGRLVELLRAEAREEAQQQPGEEPEADPAAQRLRELADNIGDMSPDQQEWVEGASDEELRAFVKELRVSTGGVFRF